MSAEVARHLPGFTHPILGGEAYECVTCDGIFYALTIPPTVCPYCADDEDASWADAEDES